jgi:hypothetical protein
MQPPRNATIAEILERTPVRAAVLSREKRRGVSTATIFVDIIGSAK